MTHKEPRRFWAELKTWAIGLADEFNAQNSGCVISACGVFIVDAKGAAEVHEIKGEVGDNVSKKIRG